MKIILFGWQVFSFLSPLCLRMYGYSEMTFLVYHDWEANEQSTVMDRNLVANTSSNKTFVVVTNVIYTLMFWVISNKEKNAWPNCSIVKRGRVTTDVLSHFHAPCKLNHLEPRGNKRNFDKKVKPNRETKNDTRMVKNWKG